MEVRYGYMCGVDFTHHLAEEGRVNDPAGAPIFGTLEALAEKKPCCMGDTDLHCAIVRVKITLEEVVKNGMR